MTTAKNAAFTTVLVLFIVAWHRASSLMEVQWDWWVWAVCCGVVLLSVSRFFMRHPVALPELGLLSFPFLFGFFFNHICPTTRVAAMDELLWSFDANFGCPQPWLGKALIGVPISFWTCRFVWSFLPFFFVVLYILLPEFIRKKYLLVLVCTGCIILPLYALCPGAGPVYLFGGDFHYYGAMRLLHPHPRFLQAGLALNTTPSGHVAWALLLFWFAYKYCRRRIAVFFGITMSITVLATLGLGEHYVIDLVLSVPYAVAIWSLVERQWMRFGMLLSIVIVWLVALREGWAILLPMPVAWLLCGMTVLAALPWRQISVPSRVAAELPSDAVCLGGALSGE